MQICSSYTMPSRDLCKIHEGMFDKPEGLSHLPECFCIDPMGWHGITDLYHPREYGMIPRDHLILLHVVADSRLPTHTTPKSAHLIYTSAALTLMGLYTVKYLCQF